MIRGTLKTFVRSKPLKYLGDNLYLLCASIAGVIMAIVMLVSFPIGFVWNFVPKIRLKREKDNAKNIL